MVWLTVTGHSHGIIFMPMKLSLNSKVFLKIPYNFNFLTILCIVNASYFEIFSPSSSPLSKWLAFTKGKMCHSWYCVWI